MPHASDCLDAAPDTPTLDQLLRTPVWLPESDIHSCHSYREACLLAWKHRQFPGMTKALLASLAGMHAPHVTNYFRPEENDRHGKPRAKLPADAIREVEKYLGNRAISQFLAHQGSYHIAEIYASRGQHGIIESIEDCEASR